jgi:hypothetical protein
MFRSGLSVARFGHSVENATTVAAKSRDGSRTVSRRNAKQSTLKNLSDMGHAAQRSAETGWRDLTDAIETAADRTHDIADGARSRLTELGHDARQRSNQARKRGREARTRGLAARDEAYRRGVAAREALAGNRPHTWRWVITAAAAGLAAGAAVAEFGRRLIRYREQAQLEKIEQTVADATTDLPVDARVNGAMPSTSNEATSVAPPAGDKSPSAGGKVGDTSAAVPPAVAE